MAKMANERRAACLDLKCIFNLQCLEVHLSFHSRLPESLTDSSCLSSSSSYRSSLDKIRDEMAAAVSSAGRGRLRKTASNLVLGKGTTGSFSVIMANDLCEVEDDEYSNDGGDDEEFEEYLPRAKVCALKER